VFAEDDEMARRVAEEGLRRYRDELGTQPRVYYRNLHRWTKAFVAVNVVFGDSDECAEGALATVQLDGVTVGEGVTDNFGDVVVDKLEPGKEYVLSVSCDGYEPVAVPVKVAESITLEPVFLTPRGAG